MDFPGGSEVKKFTYLCLDSGLGRSREEGMATTPVFLCGKSLDTGAWWTIVHGVAKSWTLLGD